jgi:microcystin degradation protein MlrC
MKPKIGVASIIQETNTFAIQSCTLEDFDANGLYRGQEIVEMYRGTNTELGGMLDALDRRGATPVPLLRAWAMSSGRLTRATLDALADLLTRELAQARSLDGLVLSLHGAMVAEGVDSADAALLDVARRVLGRSIPISVCLDLHANVTSALVSAADCLIGYRTYPHIDHAATGARATDLLLRLLSGEVSPVTVLAKAPMIVPAEGMATADSPMAELRALADAFIQQGLLDVSLFPVQPWLDVDQVGFGVVATADRDKAAALSAAKQLVTEAWERRQDFRVDLVSPAAAFERARRIKRVPFLMTQSSDSPTAGAAGDSPAMIEAWMEHGQDLTTYMTVVDHPAVQACHLAGPGREITVSLGATVDSRFHQPVTVHATVDHVGMGHVDMTGPGYTGMRVSMGAHALVHTDRLSILITERPGITFDPATWLTGGLDPFEPDVLIVRSALAYRAAFADAASDAAILDLPGASTPRIESLPFARDRGPLFPFDLMNWHVNEEGAAT